MLLGGEWAFLHCPAAVVAIHLCPKRWKSCFPSKGSCDISAAESKTCSLWCNDVKHTDPMRDGPRPYASAVEEVFNDAKSLVSLHRQCNSTAGAQSILWNKNLKDRSRDARESRQTQLHRVGKSVIDQLLISTLCSSILRLCRAFLPAMLLRRENYRPGSTEFAHHGARCAF